MPFSRKTRVGLVVLAILAICIVLSLAAKTVISFQRYARAERSCLAHNLAGAADNLIVPGVCCGVFILGKTTEREVAALPRTKDVDFQFSKSGILEGVVLSSSAYVTDRGVRVGASEEEVLQAYGQGKVGNINLTKGETVIGAVGDKVLFYPGIEFVFAKQRVWAIWLVRKE